MGLYDTIKVLDADPRITCAHGHYLTNLDTRGVPDFQTKDLGERMVCYYIAQGLLCLPQVERERLIASAGARRETL